MGCDIHFYVEKQADGIWQSADRWEPNKYADDEGEPKLAIPYEKRFYSGRNYDLFAILADVRNGRGFAGCDTGDGFVPIADPRGLPDNVSEPVKADSDRWDSDGHSHSWFTVAELLAYEWTQTTKLRGWVDATNFWKWSLWDMAKGEAPEEFCGGVSGGAVKHVPVSEMEAIAAKATEIRRESSYAEAEKWLVETHPSTYAQIEWEQPYYKAVRRFWSDTIPQLLRLGKPEEVRIVFWFDN